MRPYTKAFTDKKDPKTLTKTEIGFESLDSYESDGGLFSLSPFNDLPL